MRSLWAPGHTTQKPLRTSCNKPSELILSSTSTSILGEITALPFPPSPPPQKKKEKKEKENNYSWYMGIDYDKNGTAKLKVILNYETITTCISLSVSEEPVRFGPVVTKK